ncbi:MAG: MogA/MoaB family molybdenum cofactor biosynthesis protein [Polyangiaceae bacterium]
MKDVLVATLTVSDTRTDSDDESGRLLRTLLEDAGFELTAHRIVRDDAGIIVEATRRALHDGASMLVITGGTGIAPTDVTIEAVEPLFYKRLDGFGEAFRQLSWDDVGARAVLSRATAGVVERALVFALPGSPRAVKLGVEKIILPLAPHALRIARGESHLH